MTQCPRFHNAPSYACYDEVWVKRLSVCQKRLLRGPNRPKEAPLSLFEQILNPSLTPYYDAFAHAHVSNNAPSHNARTRPRLA
eukprot:scaffold131170_cov21-Tisochrysis_lutea.AAC.1